MQHCRHLARSTNTGRCCKLMGVEAVVMGLVVAMCLQQGTVKPQALAEEVETAVAVALP